MRRRRPSAPTRSAPPAPAAGPAVAPAPGPDAIVAELVDLVEVLRRAGAGDRPRLHAGAQALFGALARVGGPVLGSRPMVALRHEASWHMRSLAGLAESNLSRDDQHAAWALESLGQLAKGLAVG